MGGRVDLLQGSEGVDGERVQIKDYQHIVISMLHVIVEGGLLSCYLMLEK